MNENVEGHIQLDGLLEGPLPQVDNPRKCLQQWENALRQHGIEFDLSIDGARFSFLPKNKPIQIDDVGTDLSELIRDSIEQLADICDEGINGLTSTLHSSEYRPGTEIQTVYVIKGDGTVEAQRREVDAETVAPKRPATGAEKIKLAVYGLAIAVIVVGASSFFVDYGRILSTLVHQLKPIRAENIEVDTASVGKYLQVTGRQMNLSQYTLMLEISRGPDFPISDAQRAQLAESVQDDFSRRLAAEAILRGYVRCEIFDEKGRFVKAISCRVKNLRRRPKIAVEIPLDAAFRPGRIVLTY